jgi:hypothetical protein
LIYYTVYDGDGKKIADCGSESDAKWLSDMRKGTYRTNRLDWARTIDMVMDIRELPTSDIVVNMDGGVGGSWKVEPLTLENNSQKPFEA